MKKYLLYGLGALLLSAFIGKSASTPTKTEYTGSGNCGGASVATLRFEPEPTATMFPEEIWLEQCPNGKHFMRIGKRNWSEVSKTEADNGTEVLRSAGRKFAKIVD